MAATPIAFPFVEVTIDTSGLVPVAQRSPGVIAVVGKTPAGADGGAAAVNTPQTVDNTKQAAQLFAKVNPDGTVAETTLFKSLRAALLQDPKPQKIYGVRVSGNNYAAALASLEAADDVTFVSLANEVDVGADAVGTNPPTNLTALKHHVEDMSADGNKRIGVAMIDPATPKAVNYVATVTAAVNSLKSSSGRMILVAARGATTDAATAAMAAIAGFQPHISMVLKKIRGVTMPVENQFSPGEIKGLSAASIDPIIDPALIVGESLHFAEGRTFSSDAALGYIDTVRVIDDIDFRMKAGLIGQVGDARITKQGLTQVKTQVDGILGPLKRGAVIVDFAVDIPVLNILNIPETTWTATDKSIVSAARLNRTVDMFVSVTYGPAVHLLKVNLAFKS
jgi:hypothetical protein